MLRRPLRGTHRWGAVLVVLALNDNFVYDIKFTEQNRRLRRTSPRPPCATPGWSLHYFCGERV